ncbi:hypothetical protein PU683_05750 [Kosakonia cowanii]|uniref:hypothetical protein n=1 Tax=Kosakonia cowanii TaxID=208223 RepID=UPI0023F76E7B|nr:hypothetical protein [Kosakonia cowanii]MDF7759034.1 hypothetical protein [Kosakonia cowanii]
MNLPTRKYYPIAEAAKRMQCQESDVLHLISIGELDVYVYMNSFRLDDGKLMHLNMTDELEGCIDSFNSIAGEQWSVYDIMKIDDHQPFRPSGYYSGMIDGLFYLDGYNVSPLEFGERSISVQQVSSEKDAGVGGYPLDINFLNKPVVIEKSRLCVLEKDIALFNKSGTGESNKTIAKKAEIIPQLIKMIPELKGIDVDTVPVAKIISLVESVAAAQGIEMPKTDKQTWARYLGRK